MLDLYCFYGMKTMEKNCRQNNLIPFEIDQLLNLKLTWIVTDMPSCIKNTENFNFGKYETLQ